MKSRLLITLFVLALVLAAFQVSTNQEWTKRIAEWGDRLDKEAWQVGIMLGFEFPAAIPINSIDDGRIAFVGYSENPAQSDAIFVLYPNRQLEKIVDVADLAENMELNEDLLWNPAGDRLAFSTYRLCPLEDGSTRRCEGAIYIVTPDSLALVRFSWQNEFADSPIWSPDGESLLYRVSDVDDPTLDEYYAERLDGSGRRRLTESSGQTLSWGQWSPDQSYFSYLASDESGVRLHLQNLDAGEEGLQVIDLNYFGSDGESQARAISFSGFHWSPNGRYIAFSNGPETVAERENFLFDLRTNNVNLLSSRKGLLIHGWLDARTLIAEDHLQGIVSLSLRGELSEIVGGVLFFPSGCSISADGDSLLLAHYPSDLTIPQEDIYRNFVWSIPDEEVSTRIDLVDYVPGPLCWSP